MRGVFAPAHFYLLFIMTAYRGACRSKVYDLAYSLEETLEPDVFHV
jgi:hypothetical protein